MTSAARPAGKPILSRYRHEEKETDTGTTGQADENRQQEYKNNDNHMGLS